MSETVSIKFKIEGQGEFKNLAVDVEDLNNAIKHATKQATEFKTRPSGE